MFDSRQTQNDFLYNMEGVYAKFMIRLHKAPSKTRKTQNTQDFKKKAKRHFTFNKHLYQFTDSA